MAIGIWCTGWYARTYWHSSPVHARCMSCAGHSRGNSSLIVRSSGSGALGDLPPGEPLEAEAPSQPVAASGLLEMPTDSILEPVADDLSSDQQLPLKALPANATASAEQVLNTGNS